MKPMIKPEYRPVQMQMATRHHVTPVKFETAKVLGKKPYDNKKMIGVSISVEATN